MSSGVGLAAAGVAVLCFGSNFVVTKKYKSGDGMFFQWVMSTGIFMTGLVTMLIQCTVECSTTDGISCSLSSTATCPTFQPLAMLGGAIWCTGNIVTVPIIKTIGLSLGLLTWGLVGMLVGWATNRFGLLGLHAQPVSNPALNDAGVAIAVLALMVFAFVKPSISKVGSGAGGRGKGQGEYEDEHDAAYSGLYANAELGWSQHSLPLTGGINAAENGGAGGGGGEEEDDEPSFADKLSPVQKSLFGFGASAFAGLCYGNNFNPPQYIADHASQFPGASGDLKAYIFSHFAGIMLSSTAYLLLYCAYRRNAPVVFPEIILPGFVSGVVWAIAQVSWFYAGSFLSQVVAFPLISIGPGLVGALWGVFVFGEISGKKNYVLVTIAFILISVAAALIVMSH